MPLPQEPSGSAASPVRPSPLGPPESSETPQDSTEPHDETNVTDQGAEQEEKRDPLPEFDPRYTQPFEGLMFIGALTDSFKWLGHEFVIRTLTTDEVLSVALITAKYEGTLGAQRAYVTAVAAMATQTVDGEHLPTPYKKDDTGNSYAEGRFNFVKANWFSPTIDAVYNKYLILENTVREVVAEMGNASG